MSEKIKKGILVFFAIGFGFLFGRFIYFNIVTPWPYRDALHACLEEAKTKSTTEFQDYHRNLCFRTYPHFN